MSIPFTRTTCACAQCVRCCKTQPGPLMPGDYERITTFLGEPADKYLWASQGAKVMHTGTGEISWIRTITPRFDKECGRCVFLDDNDRCKIHPVSPAGCAYFDTHMDYIEGTTRSAWIHRMIRDDETYSALRATLPAADHYNPTVREPHATTTPTTEPTRH